MRNRRIAKKARRIERSEIDREFTGAMNTLRAEHDEQIREARADYEKAHKDLLTAWAQQRREIGDKYNEERDKIVREFAKKEKEIEAPKAAQSRVAKQQKVAR
jgi:hypothetical protein